MLLNDMHTLIKYAAALFVLVSEVSLASVLDDLSLYQGAALVDSLDESEKSMHLIVLGALEKVNHELEPEQLTMLAGRKSSRTYYLPLARRTKEVSTFYRGQLVLQGELTFECYGRSCGSSSYWANHILGQAILYGPEQFQHYQVYELPDEGGYLAVYVGQRATRKIYVHVESITPMPLSPRRD